jgi:DNA replication and repair protein RecF
VILKELHLFQYKNYEDIRLQFSPTINLICGKNGSGKTNILDAIYYLAYCKSYATRIDANNILFGKEAFLIKGIFDVNDKIETIKINYENGAKKTVNRNGKDLLKLTDHIGLLPIVMVSPIDIDLINEGSETRRKFMDSIISMVDKDYLHKLVEYNKLLLNRNTILKQIPAPTIELLEAIDFRLIAAGNFILKKRKEFINEFLPLLKHFYQEISGNTETIDMQYESQLNEGNFENLLILNYKKDMAAQYTTIGIHKDDFIFIIKEHPVKKLASQGQQKTYLLALRIAQYEYLKKWKEMNPVFLLDDIFDKLDENRIDQLMYLAATGKLGQVFVTDTHALRLKQLAEKFNLHYHFFEIENGTLSHEEI